MEKQTMDTIQSKLPLSHEQMGLLPASCLLTLEGLAHLLNEYRKIEETQLELLNANRGLGGGKALRLARGATALAEEALERYIHSPGFDGRGSGTLPPFPWIDLSTLGEEYFSQHR